MKTPASHLRFRCAAHLVCAGVLLLAMLLVVPEIVVAQGQQAQSSLNDQDADIRSRQYFLRGMTRAFLGDHEGAIELYRLALELTPNEPALLSAFAEALEETDDLESALFYADQAAMLAPENAHYFRHVARLHLQNEAPEKARAAYEALLAAHPRDIDALQEYARLHAATGYLTEAIDAYERLLDEVGEIQSIRNQILQLHFRLGDTEGVENTLRTLLAENPSDAVYLRMLAEVLTQQDRNADATALYENALAADPNNVEVQVALANLYRTSGRTTEADALMAALLEVGDASVEQLLARASSLLATASVDSPSGEAAIQMLEHVLTRDSSNREAVFILGDLYFRRGNYAKASGLLEQALQHNPKEPQLWFQASAAYLQSDDPKQAAALADEGLLLFPGQLPLLRVAAYGLMESYQNRDAVERFTEALAILEETAPRDTAQKGSFLAALGLLHSRLNDTAASDSSYALAIVADPENSFALNNYAYSLASRGDQLDEALDYAKRAVALDDANASFLDTLGWVYFQLEQYEEARTWIQKSIDTGSASATVYEHMGDVEAKLGRHDSAREYWSQALEKNPDSTTLLEKLQLP